MLRNYIQSIFRGFRSNKVYTMFNVIGLAVGFACVLYISIYIRIETTYEQFLPNYDKIFRISERSYALTSPAHMEYLVENLNGVDGHTFLLNSGNFIIGTGAFKFIERKGFYVTGEFFKIFSHKIQAGSYQDFDEISNAVVITHSLANKLFDDEQALDNDIIIYEGEEERIYTVIAVVEDPPVNTHMSFNFIAHMPKALLDYERDNWRYTIYHGYLKMDSVLPTLELQKKVDRIFAQRAINNNSFEDIKNVDELLATNLLNTPLALRLDDIYLQSNLNFDLQPGGNRRYLWVFGCTALFVLLLATINFINLATAQSMKRAKEVGIRKTLGSSRKMLVMQFLSESIIISLTAAILALGFVELSGVFMKSFASLDFSFSLIGDPLYLGLLFILAIGTALLSGIYPAFYLTAFKPAQVLKGKFAYRVDTLQFRNVLVIFQFTISLCMGIFMFFIQDQLHYGLQKDPGFDKENLITLDNSINQLGVNVKSFKNNLLSDTRFINGGYFNYNLLGMSTTIVSPIENTQLIEPFRVYYQRVDSDYLPTLDVEFVAGRNFDKYIVSDSTVLIINETAQKKFGFENPLGQYINFGGSPGHFKIIGIIKDLHHQSFDKKVPPTLFVYSKWADNSLLIRLSKGDVAGSINQLNNIWKAHTDQPLDFQFVDQQFEKLFDKEQQLGKIISIFTGLAFFVACLGLLGLVGYTAEQKTKEIGIRKAIGASVEQIVAMFSNKFAKLVLIAMIFAVPIAYYITDMWLNTFVYRIEMKVWPFFFIGLLGLLIVLATVSYHLINAAIANPVTALKDE